MIRVFLFVVLLVSISRIAAAAPGDVSLDKPAVSCPRTQFGDPPMQSQYDTFWKAYEEQVAAATMTVERELSRLYDSAKSAGNLDLVLFWDGMRKSWAEKGQLRWEPASQRRNWRRFGEAEFPEGLSDLLATCDEGYDKARASLEDGYKALEVALTKADRLDQALATRKEYKALWGQEPAEVAKDAAPPPKPEVTDLLKQLKPEDAKGWKRAAGVYVGTTQNGQLRTPVAGMTDYDLVAEIRLRNTAEADGLFGVDLGLPVVEGSPHTAIHGPKNRSSCWYFPTASTGEKQAPLIAPIADGFKPNEWHEVVVRVRKEEGSVTILVDGKEFVKASPFSGLPMTTNATIRANTGNNEIMIRKWEIRRIR